MGNQKNRKPTKKSKKTKPIELLSSPPLPPPPRPRPRPKPAYQGAPVIHNDIPERGDLEAARLLAGLRDRVSSSAANRPPSGSTAAASVLEHPRDLNRWSNGRTVAGDSDEEELEEESEEEEIKEDEEDDGREGESVGQVELGPFDDGVGREMMDAIFTAVTVPKTRTVPHKTSAEHDHDPSAASLTSEVFPIRFQVPCGGTMKELTLLSDTPWTTARIAFANKMVRDGATLRLAYLLSWNQKGPKKLPMSLEDAEEWEGLKQHVREYVDTEKRKYNGKGVVKAFAVMLSVQAEPSKQTKGQTRESEDTTEDGNAQTRKNDTAKFNRILGEIQQHFYCAKCDRTCIIVPPNSHRNFSVKELTSWTNGVVAGVESVDKVPSKLLAPQVSGGGKDTVNDADPPPPVTPPAAPQSSQQALLPPAPAPAQFLLSAFPMQYPFMASLNPYMAPPNSFMAPSNPFAAAMYGIPPPMSYPVATSMSSMPLPYGTIPQTPQTPRHVHNSSLESPTAHHSRRRSRRDSNASILDEDIDYLSLQNWLYSLDNHPVHGRDQQNYYAWLDVLHGESLLRLNDLTVPTMTVDRLRQLTQMPEGIAMQILRWARKDQQELEDAARRQKRRRY
ncbi:hypothetical protein B0H21DRAFT_821268 [Amylocystis lapponica]|nr:hypothetical protein B0H21DRAFT_821268 [Amylocystis lapponica]